jgi:hypothetical protein
MGYEIIPVADIICFLMKIVKVYEMYIIHILSHESKK